jgi:multisubunit Na+/H+ antiporter MnhB subunit
MMYMDSPATRRPARSEKAALICLMILGSLSMWIANPALWLWITAHLQQGIDPQMGPYALMLVGITLTCVVLGKAISAVHRRYERITGTTPTIRLILPWRRSLRGGRSQRRETDGRREVNALDVIMVISVCLAVVSFTTWFVIEKPTPPGVGPGPAKSN